MNNLTAFLFCVFCSAVAFFVLGINYFALYQLLPIFIFYIFHITVFNKIKGTLLVVCYVLSVLLLLIFPLSAQISWYYDIDHLASKSSTSGLLFVWLPIYAVIPGIIPCLVAWIFKPKKASV